MEIDAVLPAEITKPQKADHQRSEGEAGEFADLLLTLLPGLNNLMAPFSNAGQDKAGNQPAPENQGAGQAPVIQAGQGKPQAINSLVHMTPGDEIPESVTANPAPKLTGSGAQTGFPQNGSVQTGFPLENPAGTTLVTRTDALAVPAAVTVGSPVPLPSGTANVVFAAQPETVTMTGSQGPQPEAEAANDGSFNPRQVNGANQNPALQQEPIAALAGDAIRNPLSEMKKAENIRQETGLAQADPNGIDIGHSGEKTVRPGTNGEPGKNPGNLFEAGLTNEKTAPLQENPSDEPAVFIQNLPEQKPQELKQPGEAKVPIGELPKELPKLIEKELGFESLKVGTKDVTIKLEPQDLGKLTVKLSASDGAVSVKIITEHNQIKNLVESGLQNLRQSFTDQGIRFGHMEVEVGNQFLNQQQQQHQPNWSHEKNGFQQPGAWFDQAEYGTEEEIRPWTNQTGLTSYSSVDYIA